MSNCRNVSPVNTSVAEKEWFINARYGLFIHYGLSSILGRGEWVFNREQIPVDQYKSLTKQFNAERLDFDQVLNKARNDWGMRYATLTTKHHEGFCLFDSKLSDFKSINIVQLFKMSIKSIKSKKSIKLIKFNKIQFVQ